MIAGFQPAYSTDQPERLNLRYVEKDGQAWWLADPVPQLPASLRAVAAFSMTPQVVVAWRGYVAPAGALVTTARALRHGFAQRQQRHA